MGWGNRKSKPLSAREQERAAVLKAQVKDSLTPAKGWPDHYFVRVDDSGNRRKAVHFCDRCQQSLKTPLDRGQGALRSAAFAELHRNCTPRALDLPPVPSEEGA